MAGDHAQDQPRDTAGPAIDGPRSAASPVLVGELLVGRAGPADDAVEWALWPMEVYASGALLRVRLTPLGPWREFSEPWAVHTTVTVPASLAEHHREIVVLGEDGPLRPVESQLPVPGAESGQQPEVWDHSWTVGWWWPRKQWHGRLELRWPERGVAVELPVDPVALSTVAAARPMLVEAGAAPRQGPAGSGTAGFRGPTNRWPFPPS